MDKIFVNQMAFYGYHGVFPEETKLGQRFLVDVQANVDLVAAGLTDDVNTTVNYAEIYQLVKEIVEGEPRKLIESVAETIAAKLFEQFKLIQSCTVRVTKPDPPIPGNYHSVAVEITRERGTGYTVFKKA